eukprot:1162094-Pelagomonas_calceolata.AAC.2
MFHILRQSIAVTASLTTLDITFAEHLRLPAAAGGSGKGATTMYSLANRRLHACAALQKNRAAASLNFLT